MSSCLGFYISENIVKYAKMTMDNNKNITLEHYGIRFVRGEVNQLLNNIIEETNSSKDLLAINTQNDIFINYTMFDQGNTKNFARDVAKMEFESWCEKNGKIPAKYSYVYKVGEVLNNDNKFNAVLNVIEKDSLSNYNTIGNTKVTDVFPVQFLMERLVPADESSYILVNLDEKLSISVVIEDKLADFKAYDFGMSDLLEKFSERLGSYQKAYDACKQLNVYSDEETNNDKKLEEIAEPILQEILKSVAVMVNKYRKNVNKIILSGIGVVFTNIDILFREYLSITCDVLKPDFLKNTSNIRNLVEALESTEAMAIALETVSPRHPELDYIKSSGKFKNKFNKLASKQTKENNKVKKTPNKEFMAGDNIYLSIATCASIVLGLVVIAYTIFSNIYIRSVNKTLADIKEAQTKVDAQISKVSSDKSYVDKNKNEYKKINDKVTEVVDEIEKSNVKKYTTYNVAAFLQNIIKIIPKNVKLVSITSDDNKNVVIKAESSSYANLGYFVSALKLSGTLNDISIKNVENSTSTTIEIGGELP